MKKKILLSTILLVLIHAAGFSQNLLIKKATVVTVTRGTIEGGDILIQNGVITEIGIGLKAPEGTPVIKAEGRFAVPGLLDPHTHIAITDVNEMGATITPQVDVADVLDEDDLRILYALAGGVTMVHTMHGSGNPIGGRNVTLKLKWGRPPEEMIVKEAYPTVKFALGENPKQALFFPPTPRYPKSRMGVIAIIRRELEKARDYSRKWDSYRQARQEPGHIGFLMPPRKDLKMETLAGVLRKEILVRCHTYRADETLELVNLSREFGFKIACFDHASEAYKVADELAAAGIGVSVFAESWAYKFETLEGIAQNAAICAKKGVLVSLNSDTGPQMQYLFNDAAKTIKYGGLSESEALKLITINPAKQLGVDQIVGSLEVGKHGDIALFSRHPLDSYTRCDMTIIEGKVYFDRNQVVGKDKGKKEKSHE